MGATEQVQALQRVELESAFHVGRTVLDGLEQVTRLNLEMLRDSTRDVTQLFEAAFSARDLQELMNAQAGHPLRSNGDRAAEYGRRLAEIAAGTQAEMTGALTGGLRRLQEAMAPGGGDGAGQFAAATVAPTQAFLKGMADFTAQAFDAMRQAQGEVTRAVATSGERAAATATRNPAAPAPRKARG